MLLALIVVGALIVAAGAVIAAIRASRANTPPIPQGWYRDEHNPTIERFHDGTGWTKQTRPNPDED